MAAIINRNSMNISRSVNTTKYQGNADFMIIDKFPAIEAALGIPQKYRKISNEVIVEMTDPEKNAVEVVLAATAAQAEEDRKDVSKSPDLLFRSLALVMLEELNVIRENAGLDARTIDQLRTAIKKKYDAVSI